MVEFLNTHFEKFGEYEELSIVSDGICKNNSKKYLNFDKFIESLFKKNYFKGDTFSSPDTVLINLEKKHLIFIEFKNMSSFDNEKEIKDWWKYKNSNVYLKMTDSILGLSHYLNQNHNISYDKFMESKKSFIYVYKADTHKKKIHRHLANKLNRYNFLFENVKSIETQTFEYFLVEEGL